MYIQVQHHLQRAVQAAVERARDQGPSQRLGRPPPSHSRWVMYMRCAYMRFVRYVCMKFS